MSLVLPLFFPVMRIFFFITFTAMIFLPDTFAFTFRLPVFFTLTVTCPPPATITFVFETLIFVAAAAPSGSSGESTEAAKRPAASKLAMIRFPFFFFIRKLLLWSCYVVNSYASVKGSKKLRFFSLAGATDAKHLDFGVIIPQINPLAKKNTISAT